MTIAADAFEVQALTDLLYTSSTYAGKTDAEKRKLIKKKLDDYNFAINTAPVSRQIISDVLEGASTPSEIQAPAVSEGVVFVRAHYDGTTKTAIIKQGKPVCFDMTNGTCVTGISDTWGADEYKVVGIAMKDYTTVNTIGRIPIRLIPPAAAGSAEVALFMTKAHVIVPAAYPVFVSPSGGSPSTRRVYPAVKLSNPTWSGDGSGGVSAGSGDEVDIFNIGAIPRFVPEFTQLVGWTVGDKWYCEYIPPPMVQGVLTSDLLLTTPNSYATINVSTPGGVFTSSEKVKSMGQRPGYKYASGVVVIAALIGVEYVVIKAYQCPVPQ